MPEAKASNPSVNRPKYRPPTKSSDPAAFTKMMRHRREIAIRNVQLELLASDDPNAMQKIGTVQARTGLSAPTIYRKIRLGEFPPPTRLGSRCSRWTSASITAWLLAQAGA